MMKFHHILPTLIALFAISFSAVAEEWSWDWPISATQDNKDKNGYANGFYNFSSSADPDLISQTKTFNGITWTANFDKGCILAYTTGNGQTIGQANKACTNTFEMSTDSFSGKIKSVSVSARANLEEATVSVSVDGSAYLCNGSATPSINSAKDLIDNSFIPADDAKEGTLRITLNTPGIKSPSYIKKITIVYESSEATIEAPVFTPAAGSYDEPFNVTITGPEGAEILYTLDGTSPKTEGKVYSGPIKITESTDIRAVAKVGDDYSSVAVASYIIRVSPELALEKENFTIELLEEDLIFVRNPYNVAPLTYSSSNSAVAYCDKYGHIYTYSVGTATISVSFAGNDSYLPQTLTANVEVVAKEPLANLTASHPSGKYEGPLEVTFTCSDNRAKAIWYYVGDEKMSLDDLGILDEFTINPSTTLRLTLDKTCILSVQAIGDNVWSAPLYVEYDITTPLKADFSGPESVEIAYRNGFDSQSEANEWETSSGSNWQLTSDAGGYNVQDFSSINPDSKYSLFHAYANTGDAAIVSSPTIEIPANGKVRFYALFNPVWIYFGNLELYICEDADNAKPEKIWDANLASQQAEVDDPNWNQYSVDIASWAGKKVYFSFAYHLTDGDNVVIDDFEVVAPSAYSENITIYAGDTVKFTNLSEGYPESYEWIFTGAETETSNEFEPSVTYNNAGTFNVSLTAKRGDETSTCLKEAYVVVRAQAPKALIDINAPGCYYSPEASLVVPVNHPLSFRSISTGMPTEFDWKLPGTDILTASTSEVTVKYTKPGSYDVDLTVKNDVGSASTYIHGVKAGEKSLVWNIPANENEYLGLTALGWYGYYGGTNWLDMEAFAEHFEAPAEPAVIDAVNIYFGSTEAISTDAKITVAITKQNAEGMPGEEIASTYLTVAQLVDASQTYNDPTVFTFSEPVSINEPFFVTVSGFPNNADMSGEDAVAMYSIRRGPDGVNTAYHLIAEVDDNWQPTGESHWYAQTDDPCSFAIAPSLTFNSPSGIETIDAELNPKEAAETAYYTLSGLKVDPRNLVPGIYILRRGAKAEKILIK